MNFIKYNNSGTIKVDLLESPDSGSITVSAVNSARAVLSESLDFSYQHVNTQLSTAISAGGFNLVVASTSSIVPYGRYVLGGSESDGGETVTVKSLSGSTILLFSPVIQDRAIGATLQSIQLEVTIPATLTTTVSRNNLLQINFERDSVTQPTFDVSFDIVRFNTRPKLTVEILRNLFPNYARFIPALGLWANVKEQSWNQLLSYLSTEIHPGSLINDEALTLAHAYLLMSEALYKGGSEYESQANILHDRYQTYLRQAVKNGGLDVNNDGVINGKYDYKTSNVDLLIQ